MQQAPPEERLPVALAGGGTKPLPRTGKPGSRPLRVLSAAEVRRLLCCIETDAEEGLRDLAMLGLMIYCFVRAGALPALRVRDYERDGEDRSLRLNAGGSGERRIPVHHQAAAYLDAYLQVAGIAEDADGLLFRPARGHGRLRQRLATGGEILRMAKWRARMAGLSRAISGDTLRVSGIALFLEQGGTISQAKAMAGFRTDTLLLRYIAGTVAGE